jgi:hypothetical protein
VKVSGAARWRTAEPPDMPIELGAPVRLVFVHKAHQFGNPAGALF